MDQNREAITFTGTKQKIDFNEVKKWLHDVATSYGSSVYRLNYQFVSREKIIEVNTKHLSHQYATDVITFDFSSNTKLVADVVVCEEVIESFAMDNNLIYLQEWLRVVVHALLHVLGFNDTGEEEVKEMRIKENLALKMWNERWN